MWRDAAESDRWLNAPVKPKMLNKHTVLFKSPKLWRDVAVVIGSPTVKLPDATKRPIHSPASVENPADLQSENQAEEDEQAGAPKKKKLMFNNAKEGYETKAEKRNRKAKEKRAKERAKADAMDQEGEERDSDEDSVDESEDEEENTHGASAGLMES